MYENKTIGSATKPAHTLSTILHVETQKKYNFGLVYCLKCVIVVARFHLLLLSTWSISHAHAHTECVVIERLHCFTNAHVCINAVCVFVCRRDLCSICNYHILGSLLFRSTFAPPFTSVETKEKSIGILSLSRALLPFRCRIFIIHNALLRFEHVLVDACTLDGSFGASASAR